MKVVQEVWVIMDKKKKAIACGVPRNREMKMFEDCNSRILTYQSEAKARAGFKVSGFYDRTRKAGEGYQDQSYLDKTYGKPVVFVSSWDNKERTRYEWRYEDVCIPVKAKIVIETED